MKKSFFSALFLLWGISFSSVAQLNNTVYSTSGCASGGFDYFFMSDGGVIGVCSGCESIPYIQEGRYKMHNDNVILSFTKDYQGQGSGEIIQVSSINHYQDYIAKTNKINETETFPSSYFVPDNSSCEETLQHNFATTDVHQFLRNKMKGEYPFTAIRLVTEKDLDGLSKAELRIMRNEIFARYNREFKSKDLREHFSKQKGYRSYLKDVAAFLSSIEKQNVAFIKKHE